MLSRDDSILARVQDVLVDEFTYLNRKLSKGENFLIKQVVDKAKTSDTKIESLLKQLDNIFEDV